MCCNIFTSTVQPVKYINFLIFLGNMVGTRYLFIQHLLSALYTNNYVLMRYLKKYIYRYLYTVIIIVDRILLVIVICYILHCMQIR